MQEETDAEAMVGLEAVEVAPIHIVRQGLSIIPTTMDTIKQDTIQIGIQTQVALLVLMVQMATQVMPKSSQAEMETEDPMSL